MRTEGILTFSTTSPSLTYLTTAPWVKTKWSDSGSKWQFLEKKKKKPKHKTGNEEKETFDALTECKVSLEIGIHNSLLLFEHLVGADSVRTLKAKKGRVRDCDGNSQ